LILAVFSKQRMEIIENGESETQRIKGWIAFDKRMIVNVRIE